MTPSTAAWTTDSMLPAAGDEGLSAWAQNVAENTGFNYYQTQAVSILGSQVENRDGIPSTTSTWKVYMTAGSYTAYAVGSFFNRNNVSTVGTIKLDGTDIIAHGSADGTNGWHYNTAGVTIAADGWVEAKYTVIYALFAESAIYVHKVSP